MDIKRKVAEPLGVTITGMGAGEQQIQTVRISASQSGRRGAVKYSVEWQEGDNVASQPGYRTLADAMAFCPCSMDADKVKREVVPGVRVHNPYPRGMCGHSGSHLPARREDRGGVGDAA